MNRRPKVIALVALVIVVAAAILIWFGLGDRGATPVAGASSIPAGIVEQSLVTMNEGPLTSVAAGESEIADVQTLQMNEDVAFAGWFDLSEDYVNSLTDGGRSEPNILLLLGMHAHIDGSNDVTAIPFRLRPGFTDDGRMNFEGNGTAPATPGVYHVSIGVFTDPSQPAEMLFQTFVRVAE